MDAFPLFFKCSFEQLIISIHSIPINNFNLYSKLPIIDVAIFQLVCPMIVYLSVDILYHNVFNLLCEINRFVEFLEITLFRMSILSHGIAMC